jgi:hypothetical protein
MLFANGGSYKNIVLSFKKKGNWRVGFNLRLSLQPVFKK